MDGSRVLLYLPGAVMVGREPLDLGHWPDMGPGRVTRAVLGAAYALLQVGCGAHLGVFMARWGGVLERPRLPWRAQHMLLQVDTSPG